MGRGQVRGQTGPIQPLTPPTATIDIMTKIREWIAWKLQCLAVIIYDSSYQEYVNVLRPDGKTALSVAVIGDAHAVGIDFVDSTGMPEDWRVDVW